MYFVWGLVFCIGFLIGTAYGIVRGKKELASDLRQDADQFQNPQLKEFIERLLDKHMRD